MFIKRNITLVFRYIFVFFKIGPITVRWPTTVVFTLPELRKAYENLGLHSVQLQLQLGQAGISNSLTFPSTSCVPNFVERAAACLIKPLKTLSSLSIITDVLLG